MKFFNLINKKSKLKEYINTALHKRAAKAISDKRAVMAKGDASGI